jgi:hypothetical protein
LEKVQVAVAADLAEAEEIQTILRSAGIESELHPAVEQHPTALDDAPTQVLVDERSLVAAQEAIEAMSEPDDLLGGR